jgi:5-methyltetrahydrofolate corrinoid/iron sulfur protein methyltransferase
MLIIGENIHIISPRVKEAIETRDAKFIQGLALRQVKAGAGILDLNIGPQKKRGTEVMPWIVETVHAVTDIPLSLDTTNVAAMEAGLEVCKKLGIRAMLNSASADPGRLDPVMELAARYHARVIALTMGVDGIPSTADGRTAIAMEILLPKAESLGIPMPDVFLDPLVLTVNGNQDVAQETVNAIRVFKQLADPPPLTTVGASNISNSCPNENRSLINRTFLVMLMAAGLDSAIADPLDTKQMEFIRLVEERDTATPMGRLVVALYDATAAMEDLDASLVDRSDQEQLEFFKTYQILNNQIIYAHSYLRI